MQSRQRIGLLAAAIVIAIAAFVIAGSGGSGKHRRQTRQFHVVVAGGKPQGGIQKLVANKGDEINLEVTSNVADEIHVHGYNLRTVIQRPGRSAHFSFAATIDGIFVIELESRAEQIASLQVNA
jgi:hypothetical protein